MTRPASIETARLRLVVLLAPEVAALIDDDTEAASAANIVVGSINLKGPPDADGDVEIGWGISAMYRRRGYACDAVAAVIEWAVRQPAAIRISATIPDDNIPSRRLAAKVGMVRTGQLRRGLPLWCRAGQ